MTDRTKELEARLKAILVNSEDTCVFFQRRTGTQIRMKRCFFCRNYKPSEIDENNGFCVFKRGEPAMHPQNHRDGRQLK